MKEAKKLPFLSGRKGFTLIELLVVISIIAMLSSTVLANVFAARKSSSSKSTYEGIVQYANAIALMKTDKGSIAVPFSGGPIVMGGNYCLGYDTICENAAGAAFSTFWQNRKDLTDGFNGYIELKNPQPNSVKFNTSLSTYRKGATIECTAIDQPTWAAVAGNCTRFVIRFFLDNMPCPAISHTSWTIQNLSYCYIDSEDF